MRKSSVWSVIGWMLLSVLVPGAAHLRAGRRRTGTVTLSLFALLMTVLAVAVMTNGTQLAGLLLDSAWVTGVIIACVVGAMAWGVLVISSYVAMRPGRLPRRAQAVTGALAGLTTVAVTLPFMWAGGTALTSNEAIGEVFKEASLPASPRPAASVTPTTKTLPRQGVSKRGSACAA
ncbi:hypothetical protein ACFWY5_54910 [Nonomuraea sp. NPDC059007]|uniref:hypothetical protein n=1 Tax=Nonomuraea sp. NPDC059007 TaxID=3346692 RepID=UPI003677985A